jgi:hypothetical protein
MIGALAYAAFSLVYVIGLDNLGSPVDIARVVLAVLLYGLAIGLLPAVATSFVHLALQKKTLTRPQFISAVCGAGAGIAIAFAGVLTANVSNWFLVVTMAVAAALASLVVGLILTRGRPSAT